MIELTGEIFWPLQHKLQGVLHLFPSTGSVTWGFWMKNCDFNEKHHGKMVTLYKQMVIQIGNMDSVVGLIHWTNGSHYMRHVDMVECVKHFQVQYQHMSMKQSQYVGITITVVFLPLKKTSNFVLTWLNHKTRRTKDHLDVYRIHWGNRPCRVPPVMLSHLKKHQTTPGGFDSKLDVLVQFILLFLYIYILYVMYIYIWCIYIYIYIWCMYIYIYMMYMYIWCVYIYIWCIYIWCIYI